MEDYGLDAVALVVLGEGKTLAGHDRAEEILRLFEEDRERLVLYNRTDARLALEVLERLRLVELGVERSRLTGLPLLRPAPGQCHHRLRTRTAPMVPGTDRSGGPSGAVRRHRDSLFVETGAVDAGAARAFGETLAARLDRDLARHVADRWRVTSRLDLVFDRLYLRLALLGQDYIPTSGSPPPAPRASIPSS